MTPIEMQHAAAAVMAIPGGCPVSWMADRLPSDALPVADILPPRDTQVLGWVSDPAVCIWHFPVVVRRDSNAIWAGLPGNWVALADKRWTLTHWRAL